MVVRQLTGFSGGPGRVRRGGAVKNVEPPENAGTAGAESGMEGEAEQPALVEIGGPWHKFRRDIKNGTGSSAPFSMI